MFKNIANMASIVKQAQQMGGKIQEVNEQLKAKRVAAQSGGGMVEVEANGLGKILRIKIDAELVQRGDREMIEDLLPGAINQAIDKSKQLQMEMMTEDFQIPGLGEAISNLTQPGE